VLWSGLKGAVPILLGTYILGSNEGHRVEAYDVVFIVVLFSVAVQGGLVPWMARRLDLPVSVVEQEPWSLGLRFRDEPEGMHRFTVTGDSPAHGAMLEGLPLGENVWVSLIGRDGRLIQVRGDTVLQEGDQVFVLAEPQDAQQVRALFTGPTLPTPPTPPTPAVPDGA
jgi:cell volume regulation protein A